ALGLIKRAAAEVNAELGLLEPRVAEAIARAAQEVADGAFDDQFPIDVYQTGSATSTNTNANEVIAVRASEHLGGGRGNRLVHPNDHVNKCQSSNDVIPTAMQLAALAVIPLGGTAVGTGINSHPQYAARAAARLAELTGLPVRETPNHFHAQAALDAVIAAHGQLRTVALSLWKVASDVRLMGMGPRAGLAELALPETQPGSSIMPGKVNPAIVEAPTMVLARVVG